MLSGIFTRVCASTAKSYSLGVTRDESLQYGASRLRSAAEVDQVNCKTVPVVGDIGLQVPTVKVMNWVFILIILVLGLGLGGWASIKTMDEKVKEFELFDRCNGCWLSII